MSHQPARRDVLPTDGAARLITQKEESLLLSHLLAIVSEMKTLMGDFASVRQAALLRSPVTSGIHDFYRYPARFSPELAHAAIEAFTEPGQLVLDPFVGGGTSLVEAQAAGRPSVGFDINPLAVLVSKAKMTLYSSQALREIAAWQQSIPKTLNAHKVARIDSFWIEQGYFRNFETHEVWALRKLIAQALTSLEGLSEKPRLFARCALLRTAQWALDLRDEMPTASEFRDYLDARVSVMAEDARNYRRNVLASARSLDLHHRYLAPAVEERSIERIDRSRLFLNRTSPRLILTSPPYPGVYVLYHRWKIHARKETAIPYWIANSLDGRGLSHYILGPRLEPDLKRYFENLRLAFAALIRLTNSDTTFVQVVGFSEPAWQLPQYLATLKHAGLREILFDELATQSDGRLWREVPGRRWFAKHQESAASTAREVVLFHKLRD